MNNKSNKAQNNLKSNNNNQNSSRVEFAEEMNMNSTKKANKNKKADCKNK